MPPPPTINSSSVLWLMKESPELLKGLTEKEKKDMEGKWNHPILILVRVGGGFGQNAVGTSVQSSPSDSFYVLLITSFSGRTRTGGLTDIFPTRLKSVKKKNRKIRAKYLPLSHEPPAPHPDNHILLITCINGKPSDVFRKQSYVRLEPFTVKREWIHNYEGGRATLEDASFQKMMTELRRLCPQHQAIQLWNQYSQSQIPATVAAKGSSTISGSFATPATGADTRTLERAKKGGKKTRGKSRQLKSTNSKPINEGESSKPATATRSSNHAIRAMPSNLQANTAPEPVTRSTQPEFMSIAPTSTSYHVRAASHQQQRTNAALTTRSAQNFHSQPTIEFAAAARQSQNSTIARVIPSPIVSRQPDATERTTFLSRLQPQQPNRYRNYTRNPYEDLPRLESQPVSNWSTRGRNSVRASEGGGGSGLSKRILYLISCAIILASCIGLIWFLSYFLAQMQKKLGTFRTEINRVASSVFNYIRSLGRAGNDGSKDLRQWVSDFNGSSDLATFGTEIHDKGSQVISNLRSMDFVAFGTEIYDKGSQALNHLSSGDLAASGAAIYREASKGLSSLRSGQLKALGAKAHDVGSSAFDYLRSRFT